jgi:DNA repair exonuclease SbcCD ATPase subunit
MYPCPNVITYMVLIYHQLQFERDQLDSTLESVHNTLDVRTQERDSLDDDLQKKMEFIEKLENDINALNMAMVNLEEEKDQVIDTKNAKLDEREAVINQQGKDIEALRDENLRVLAERDELRKALALRGKDVSTLFIEITEVLGWSRISAGDTSQAL